MVAAERIHAAVPEAALRARRLGVFGGTFDPVHAGHLFAAREAARAFGLDFVLFVPAARSPHKDRAPRATGAQRMAMLALALAPEPRFGATDLELVRGAPSYTIDTVRELERLRGSAGPIFLVIGSDNLSGIAAWRGVEDLLARTRPIVVRRVVRRRGDADERNTADGELAASAPGLSSSARARLSAGFLELPPVDVAARELRERLAGRGAVSDAELPRAVAEYARENGIYV